MKIILTGGAGFIGSHIVDSYIEKGHEVVIIDDMSHGFRDNVNPKARMYKLDIRNLQAMRRVMHNEKPDVINHHAAVAEVVTSVRNPSLTMEVNVLGTINLLLTGGEIGIKKFIFSSTGGVIYGDTKKLPATEATPTDPISPYGLSKLLAEQAIDYYAKNFGFNYTIFRYGNVFGPRQDPKGEAGVVAIFAKLLREQKPVTIFGDGTKTRDYVYIDDVVRANATALTRGKDVVLNLGWGKEISDQLVYDTIATHFPNAKAASYKKVRKGEVMHICVSPKKAATAIQWKPRVSFEEGVELYMEHTKEQPDN